MLFAGRTCDARPSCVLTTECQMRARHRLPLLVAAALAIALVVGSILLYPHLPPRIPQHFNLSGVPDRWVDTSWASWMLEPIVALAVTGFILVIAWIIPCDLRLLNLPDKERLVALPRERQDEILAIIRAALRWIAAIVLALFVGVQAEVFLVARSGAPAGGSLVALPLVAVVAIFAIVVGLQRRIRR
jgi:uncharacterized membrane protein